MGGFSDNYECGYWGDDTPPIQRKKKVTNDKFKNSNIEISYSVTNDGLYQYLDVLLTPINLLHSDEQEERINLIQLCNTLTQLELKITQDKKLEIYYDEVFIGYVQKVFEKENIDNTKIIDNFCFVDGKMQEIEALWNGEVFCLSNIRY